MSYVLGSSWRDMRGGLGGCDSEQEDVLLLEL